jgi:hydrogenase maturation protease
LVIGYGNPLRCDDGVGWHVAQALAADPRAAGLTVIAAHQLMPEHAEDIHRARVAILVDAEVDDARPLAPGRCRTTRIDPGSGADAASTTTVSTAWSHHCGPESLAMMAVECYGSAAPIILVGVGVSSLGASECPTPQVAQAIPDIVDLVLRLAGTD